MYSYNDYPIGIRKSKISINGKFMEDYEDSTEGEKCAVLCHTMKQCQSAGSCFTWKETDIKKGVIRDTYTSFIYLYVYGTLRNKFSSKYDTINKF